MNASAYRDLSPKQIVPKLADEGRYLASESSIYRILREEGQLTHRGRAKAPVRRPPTPHVATGKNQVWSWDITYLKAPVRGTFFYLYLIVDVWGRKIVGFEIQDRESPELASELIMKACVEEGVDHDGLVLHSDNGGPMKGSTMLATLQRLGVVPSFSRPSVSDDNPFSESLFRTMKYRPVFPKGPFVSLAAAREWVAGFVRWYTPSTCTAGSASSRRWTGTKVGRRRSSRSEAGSTRRPVVADQIGGPDPPETGARWAGST